jgi:hypothetical protein
VGRTIGEECLALGIRDSPQLPRKLTPGSDSTNLPWLANKSAGLVSTLGYCLVDSPNLIMWLCTIGL